MVSVDQSVVIDVLRDYSEQNSMNVIAFEKWSMHRQMSMSNRCQMSMNREQMEHISDALEWLEQLMTIIIEQIRHHVNDVDSDWDQIIALMDFDENEGEEEIYDQ